MQLCQKEKCTSCGACTVSCPQNAIYFETNEYGFCYPRIDDAKCVDCGLCRKSCHVLNELNGNIPQKAYAVWSSDSEDRKTSTSGGAASVFYNEVLKNKGICYGAVYDSDLKVVIKGYDDNNFLKFKNSKYVHSKMGSTFLDIKNQLKDGYEVIFIGLPCQVAALRTYLKIDFRNLILVDIICHGTPPQVYLDEHIHYFENKKSRKADEIRFRQDNEFYFSLKSSNTVKPFVSMHKNLDTYLLSFFEALTYYDSCYDCKYACNERVSDITIGDFWGLGLKEPFKHGYSGAVSVVLINTKKGVSFFDRVKNKCFCEERPVDEAIEGNAQLNYPSKMNPHRDKFLNMYKNYGFEKAAEAVYSDEIKKQKTIVKKNEIKNLARAYINKLLRR